MTHRSSPSPLTRRAILGAGALSLAAAVLPGRGMAASSAVAEAIADHFSAIRTMTGDFVQFGPRGEQAGGRFFIQRPGKVRFNYDAPSAYRVTADGSSVLIANTKLKTSDLYPLRKTPLKLLLGERIDLSASRVQSVEEDGSTVTIRMADRSVFGGSKIAMVFDARSFAIRQWTITDAQGKDTTVVVDNVRTDVKVDPGLFVIDYKKYREQNQRQIQR